MSSLAKTDSEVSSLSQSSPGRSPRRPVYYVQSPSRDSHDGEKTTNSFHSSPVLSPMGSPPHSHSNSSLGPHSRESSSTRFSASLKPGSGNKNNGTQRKGWKPWKEFDAIEEEGLLDDDVRNSRGLPRRCYFLAFVVGFFVLFSFFSLILWGASRPQKPTITVKVHHLLFLFFSLISKLFSLLFSMPFIFMLITTNEQETSSWINWILCDLCVGLCVIPEHSV